MIEFKGDLKGFPEEVVEKMLDNQEKQGNKRDVFVFEKYLTSDKSNKGFSWGYSEENQNFWNEVIREQNFDLFFQRYPKPPLYPKVMLVSDNESYWISRVVFMEKCGTFIAWFNAETIEESETVTGVRSWKYAKDLPEIKPTPEFTMEELVEKIGYNFKIKK